MRRIALLLTLVLATSGLLTAPGSAGAPVVAAKKRSGTPSAVFNAPNPWGGPGANYRIVTSVERAIRAVPGKSKKVKRPTITIASYLLDRAPSVDALIAACKRGVGVRVVLDSGINNVHSRRLITALNGDNFRDRNRDGKPDTKPRTNKCGKPRGGAKGATVGRRAVVEPFVMSRAQALRSLDVPTGDAKTWGRDRSYVMRCSGACRANSADGNMHSKFFAFSHTAGKRNVVMVSSSNLNRGGATAGWNDLVEVKGRKRFYTYFLKVHRLMTRQTTAQAGVLRVKDGPFTARFLPMRVAKKSLDPTLADLRGIQCRSGFGRTEVHVSMFFWGQRRGNYLADRLLTLARQGCIVRVIYGAPTKQLGDRLRNAARSGLIDLWDSRFDLDKDGYNEVRTHAKYVLVKGTYKGASKARLVMTGSQNWVGGMAAHDEVLLNVQLPKVYKAYRGNWQNIRTHSKRFPSS